MELFNLLSIVNDVDIGVFGETLHVHLNWIGKIIKFLIEGVGMVGVGIILFSLVLKLIVLPFDIYQRIAMRKQNIKMKENQARMEKLQKQYANNKEMYNQKVMEMYKESGISMFSSCLPMILSMVIFIVAIGAFNAFAQYSNIENYNMLVDSYNASIEADCATINEENIFYQDGKIIVKEDGKIISISFEDKTLNENSEKAELVAKISETNKNKRNYTIDTQKAMEVPEIAEYVANAAEGTEQDKAIQGYFIDRAHAAVKATYENEEFQKKTRFIWIKNIWVTDASFKHPVLGYDDFSKEVAQEEFFVDGNKVSLTEVDKYTNAYQKEAYEQITAGLEEYKKSANGWYILVALSIGTILLQQFVTMRSQKEQQQFSSVDGQGASQQKMMMIVMTGMFAIFSFIYSSAFSIYLITSNIFSLISTLVINKLVDRSMEKKEALALQEKHNQRFPGRKYVKKDENERKKK